MKLSFKFFCIAYMIVLLSTGLGGMFLIFNASDTLWSSRTERVNSAENYAVESFLSFADISSGRFTESETENIAKQIKSISDSSITEVAVISSETAGNTYSSLEDNKGFSRYVREGDKLIMESVCRVNTGTDIYYVAVYSDFTEIRNHCRLLWNGYGLAVLILAIVSGVVLYFIAGKITAPINELTVTADSIASGQYGKTVNIKNSDFEIKRLSQSFNSMSLTVEEKIREIKEETEKRDMFVGNFTHELKTPMTAIIGYADMLDSYELDEKEIKQAARAIYKEGKRLEKLSLQLLDLYVYRNEQIELEKLSLSEIEKQLGTTLVFLSRKYKVPFKTEFHREIVCANRVLLLSLLYNLADNAFKASEPESKVRIYSFKSNGKVTVCVEDGGKGIAPENIKFLTEPFFREDKARSRALGGAGLGLALCKEIAFLHGTELTFVSEQGKGTAVSFELRGEK